MAWDRQHLLLCSCFLLSLMQFCAPRLQGISAVHERYTLGVQVLNSAPGGGQLLPQRRGAGLEAHLRCCYRVVGRPHRRLQSRRPRRVRRRDLRLQRALRLLRLYLQLVLQAAPSNARSDLRLCIVHVDGAPIMLTMRGL